MSVNIFDPIELISKNKNGIPDLEKMMIYVNLKAYRRGTSTIIFNSDGYVNIDSTVDMDVDLMGVNPSTKKYTTDWSKNYGVDNNNYEGFGITNIKIKTNSSYIPQVSIEFVDIRGLNFMNRGENSPYSVLYDFPPPIFELTIKGYYGKPIKYSLHLTKQNTRFDSNSGNYIINVDFIANTFAPLTDILFKYIQMFPLMSDDERDINIDNTPRNTFELIQKLKNLYEKIDSFVKVSKDMDSFKNKNNELTKISEFFEYLNNRFFIDEEYRKNVDFYCKIKGDDNNIIKIINLKEYSKYINGEGINYVSDNTNKLYILFNNDNIFNFKINTVINNIIQQSNNILKKDDITIKQIPAELVMKLDLGNYDTNNIYNFNCIDFTKAYNKIYKLYYKNKTDKNKSFEKINDKIESYVKSNIGFKPTIRNIIKIICDDVDKMFSILKKVDSDAKEHHNKYFDLIKNKGYADVTNTVNSFPLFIESRLSSNGETKHRVYPKNKLFNDIPFPETQLVNDFISTFLDIKRNKIASNIKMENDVNGNNLWVPINPLDSAINIDNISTSPYYIDSLYDDKTSNKIELLLKILIDRYIVLSQFSYYKSLYVGTDSDLIKLYAESEAINIAESITDEKYVDGLNDIINNYDDFIKKIKEIDNRYGSRGDKIKIKNIEYDSYKDSEFSGILLLNDNSINPRISGGDTPIDIFLDKTSPNAFLKFFGVKSKYEFTKENIFIVKDEKNIENPIYMSDWYNINNLWFDEQYNITSIYKYYIDKYELIYDYLIDSNLSNKIKNILIVSLFDNIILDKLIISKERLSDYENINYPIRQGLFDAPSSLIYTIGGVLSLTNDEEIILNTIIDKINEYDVKKYNNVELIKILFGRLSNTDKKIFTDEFDNVVNGELLSYFTEFIKNIIDSNNDSEVFDRLINENDVYYENIIKPLMIKKYICNLSDITFADIHQEEFKNINYLFLNNDKNVKLFFNTFNNKLKNLLINKKRTYKNETKEFFESVNDDDIKTQIYYSFKNITDKWIRGFENSNNYPFNIGDEKLIDKFVFVDRAMNDIGDKCIIDARTLLDMSEDIDINVFTVISRLLSQNGFEFFPLQNFMNFNGNQWKESFNIYNVVNSNVLSSPAFVCMYIGGASSSLNVNDYFIDDGLISLEDGDDFKNINTDNTNGIVKYGEVNAFKVRYGLNNQSIFKGVEFDSKEYPETNESLAILSSLAKDESNSTPIPKAQNLYNLYENRAYSTKVSMLGNLMIQPTHYFEIENINLFSGSYIVLNVEHNVKPNYIETVFNGVRILKYPNPIITDFVESIGLLIGMDKDDTNDVFGDMDSESKTNQDLDDENLPSEIKYNSMHSNNNNVLKI